MFDASGARRKLIVFTEHVDTLNYLADPSGTCLVATKPWSRFTTAGARKLLSASTTNDNSVTQAL